MKPKVVIRKAPPSLNHACVADVLGLTPLEGGSLSVNWFMRVDYAATHYVGSNEDPRCPVWRTVKWCRTYNLREILELLP